MQVARSIQVQLGGRSLDVPLSNVARLPSLSSLQHHTRLYFTLSPTQTPVFFHEGVRVADERRWASLLASFTPSQGSGPTATTIRLRVDASATVEPSDPRDDHPPLGLDSAMRDAYFAVQGSNGHTTLYLEKADFDRRMAEFAREGSLAPGLRAIFPPAHKDEYARLFRENGAGIVLTTQATALLKQWHTNAAIGAGILVGGLAGGLIATGSRGIAENVLANVVAEGEVATIATEATATALSGESIASSGSGVIAKGAGAAVVAVVVGYCTYLGLKRLLPEVNKEPYTIIMSVPSEDAGMLEMGRQMSIVESATGPACGICMDRPGDSAAVPCGHTACLSCLEQLRRRHGEGDAPCPHCRRPIEGLQRIYF